MDFPINAQILHCMNHVHVIFEPTINLVSNFFFHNLSNVYLITDKRGYAALEHASLNMVGFLLLFGLFGGLSCGRLQSSLIC